MPLLWTHAEYLKLLVAREVGKPVELLKAVEERYAGGRTAETWHWRPEAAIPRLAVGRRLILEHRAPFVLHYGFDGWQGVKERTAAEGPAGIWGVVFEPTELAAKTELNFTRRFADVWEGRDHLISLGHSQLEHALTHEAG